MIFDFVFCGSSENNTVKALLSPPLFKAPSSCKKDYIVKCDELGLAYGCIPTQYNEFLIQHAWD